VSPIVSRFKRCYDILYATAEARARLAGVPRMRESLRSCRIGFIFGRAGLLRLARVLPTKSLPHEVCARPNAGELPHDGSPQAILGLDKLPLPGKQSHSIMVCSRTLRPPVRSASLGIQSRATFDRPFLSRGIPEASRGLFPSARATSGNATLSPSSLDGHYSQ
jgi:hypothetical protein